jgi:CubicO group peptidase (beta-lactamase class C family)
MFILKGSAVAIGLANLCLLGSCVQASRTPLASWTGCPVDGPLLPRPTDLGSSQIIQDATTKLTEALDSSVNGETKAGFQVDDTSFSIALVSPFVQNLNYRNDGIIWSYHHLGKNNFKGTKSLNDDSQYLIGSVSKVFSDLLLLKSDIDLAHSVTEYLPGLDKKGTPIEWSNITLSALSNHLAGIPSNLRTNPPDIYLSL